MEDILMAGPTDNTEQGAQAQDAAVQAVEEEIVVAAEDVVRGHDVPGVALEGEDSPEWVLHHQQYTIGYPGYTGPLGAAEYERKLAELQGRSNPKRPRRTSRTTAGSAKQSRSRGRAKAQAAVDPERPAEQSAARDAPSETASTS